MLNVIYEAFSKHFSLSSHIETVAKVCAFQNSVTEKGLANIIILSIILVNILVFKFYLYVIIGRGGFIYLYINFIYYIYIYIIFIYSVFFAKYSQTFLSLVIYSTRKMIHTSAALGRCQLMCNSRRTYWIRWKNSKLN